MDYKDYSMIESHSYYTLAEKILEEPEISFIFTGVKEYIDELLNDKNNYNISQDYILKFYEIFLNNSNDFYQQYLVDLNEFKILNELEKVNIIYCFLKNELPSWITNLIDYSNDSDEDNDDKNIEPYDISKIDITTSFYQASYLYDRCSFGELVLSPDYQRNFVWNAKQKSRLIESMLIQIPLPIFYLDARDEDRWIVIDGLQRLTTIFKFIDNEFKLSNLEYLKNLNGVSFKNLDRKFQRRILECQLQCNKIRPNTPPNIAFNIFQRINTLGTTLEVQELRNAMYLGKSTKLLKKLAESEEFKLIVDKNKSMKTRKDDQATILRYLAFKITDYSKYIKNNDMNEFLSNTMQLINTMNDLEIRLIEDTFIHSMQKAYMLFNNKAFRKPNNLDQKPNKALFETISYTLDLYDYEILEKFKLDINNALNDLFRDKEFILKTSVATNNPPNVHYRFNKIKETFLNVIGN
ncbi:DUF262 domain-containing protein [Aliarcobacter cryaerophilus]|uniref:DUF262 domain-containing protein n=1 Tax=Aliarcobacter cryaerophilus TaxID=28198 RepID=A0A7G9LMB2_9BACT|nr:DUF262 domain-containing protein [Aliarcobacter cryaerophilus]QNM89761.1 DUF262 domain-containing protein [Aliarcobacter cryaerophilus]